MTVQELMEELSGFAPHDKVELVEYPVVNTKDHDVYEVDEVQAHVTGARCRILFTVRQR